MDVLTGRSVVCEVRVKADPETIFPFLVDGERSARWFGRSASIDPRPGGAYRTEISDQIVAIGEIVEIDEPRRLVLTFGWEGSEAVPPGSSRVEITLEPDGDETVVRLLHDGLAEGAAEQHGDGWDHYLGRLAIAAPGGDAGPDPVGQNAPAGGGSSD
jgi:uncharacterized protein YndB with AHSA1/START domain